VSPTTTDKPVRALALTSISSPGHAALPVIAALEASGMRVRAMDVGRLGSRAGSAAARVVKAIAGELAERRLARELSANPPDVAVGFDMGSVEALWDLRRHSPNPVAVIAVVADLDPDPGWSEVSADRYLAVDAQAAVALADAGVPEERVMTVGPIAEVAYAQAGQQKREVLRARFGLPLSSPVVLCEVAGLGYETTSQLALQLSLVGQPGIHYLFAAGDDAEAATALRRSAPTLEIKAKLFGDTDDAPLLWRCADAIVARPRTRAVHRALVINAKLVSFLPEDADGERLAAQLEARGMGSSAGNALLVSSALEPLLTTPHKPSSRTGTDGAANVADIVWVVGKQAGDVVRETESSGPSAYGGGPTADAEPQAASGLEDLSGGGLEDLFGDDAPKGAKNRRLAELSVKLSQLAKSVGEAQTKIEQWENKKARAEAEGDAQKASQAGRNADLERARMHQALGQMGQLEAEIRRIENAGRPRASSGSRGPASASRSAGPSVDDVLKDMRRSEQAAVDDELEALKRKMKKGKR
jgi:hypothetical protein